LNHTHMRIRERRKIWSRVAGEVQKEIAFAFRRKRRSQQKRGKRERCGIDACRTGSGTSGVTTREHNGITALRGKKSAKRGTGQGPLGFEEEHRPHEKPMRRETKERNLHEEGHLSTKLGTIKRQKKE